MNQESQMVTHANYEVSCYGCGGCGWITVQDPPAYVPSSGGDTKEPR